jgi:streptogramin lyase
MDAFTADQEAVKPHALADGALWFTNGGNNTIGRITGPRYISALPSSGTPGLSGHSPTAASLPEIQ